ncbi:MAG: response regulator transcription factor [bacterium]|nr:response regulator transcription factor [bacterium]
MRLLIDEDEESLAKNLKRLLELKGFAVDWLTTAEKARTRIMLYRNEYGAILLDLTLPGMSGTELTKSVRAEGVTTPIIILTGKSETQYKIELLNSGADDYVVKPFSSDELIARISSVVRRPVQEIPIVRTVGQLSIDSSARRVTASGTHLTLTLKEYSLLECFMRRPNEILTREDLSNQIWDFNSLTMSNVLDVHMKNLRKKISSAAGNAARFETVRGVGYRLVLSQDEYA